MKKLSTVSIAATILFSSILCSCSPLLRNSASDASSNAQNIKVFTSFYAKPGTPISDDNIIQQKIAEKIGAKCIESWLQNGETAEDAISKMILSGEYPDFIYPENTQHQRLIDAGAYIPIDEYWDEYPNLRNYFTDDIWDKLRADDGHIYIIPAFSNVYMHSTQPKHGEEAFWVQVKVLKWAGYPEIKTLDEYFDLLDRYLEANPTDENGNENIGYEILTDGYLYFCLENPPQFLDGYPNDGCCIVNPDTLEAVDYNTTDTAKKWFKKLNEEFKKGTIDSECFLLTQDQYYSKISSGNVLGMADQGWNYQIATYNLPDECQYVPIGVVIDDSISPHYLSQPTFDYSSGLGITVSCTDVDGAVKFINDLLDPEIHDLRYWGIEGQNYNVDENGLFYLTDEQYETRKSSDYVTNVKCEYTYFPFYGGMDLDGINASTPSNQPSVFFSQLSDIMKECFTAYGVQTFVDLLNKPEENEPWFPMWSYSNTFTSDTDYGKAKEDMDRVKHEYLPKVVMSDDFESSWNEYLGVYYSECDIDAYLSELTAEIRRRAGK
ncbi:MAG: extracellular solute-binding protein [Oscillospiraceae bacterium]|nr:extracellular solute-binding protein [Oscillospiraceae bacterium]